MTLSELFVILFEKLFNQDVIKIGANIKSPKQSMALSGIELTQKRNGLQVDISMVFEIFGQILH
jgi:hypothetical protein